MIRAFLLSIVCLTTLCACTGVIDGCTKGLDPMPADYGARR